MPEQEYKDEFVDYCGLPPTDCDPVNDQWVCSSMVIGQFAPEYGNACSVTGKNLDIAKQNYQLACSIPLRD